MTRWIDKAAQFGKITQEFEVKIPPDKLFGYLESLFHFFNPDPIRTPEDEMLEILRRMDEVVQGMHENSEVTLEQAARMSGLELKNRADSIRIRKHLNANDLLTHSKQGEVWVKRLTNGASTEGNA